MTVNYILNKKINVTEDTLIHNPYTWGPPVYQIDVIELFYNLIKDDYCILDIGAQSGAFSLMAKIRIQAEPQLPKEEPAEEPKAE